MKQLYILFSILIFGLYSCSPTAKVLSISESDGEKLSRGWEEFRFKSIDTAKEYRISLKEIKRRHLYSICRVIENKLYSTNDLFSKNFYSRNGVLFVEQRYCDFDYCLQNSKVNDCHAKFIVYSDTSQILTLKNAPTLAKELISVDNYREKSNYKFFFQAYVSIWAQLDKDGITPLTRVNFNLVINAKKMGWKGMRWVKISDLDVDLQKYLNFETRLKAWMIECAEKIIAQNQ